MYVYISLSLYIYIYIYMYICICLSLSLYIYMWRSRSRASRSGCRTGGAASPGLHRSLYLLYIRVYKSLHHISFYYICHIVILIIVVVIIVHIIIIIIIIINSWFIRSGFSQRSKEKQHRVKCYPPDTLHGRFHGTPLYIVYSMLYHIT